MGIGIILAIIGILIALYFGIRQIIQWRRDAGNTNELQKNIAILTKKVDGMAVYLDGLPELQDKKRLALFEAGIQAKNEYKYDEAIKHFRECLATAKEDSEKVALLNLIGVCFYSISRFDEALGNYKEAEKIARESDNKEGLASVLGNGCCV